MSTFDSEKGTHPGMAVAHHPPAPASAQFRVLGNPGPLYVLSALPPHARADCRVLVVLRPCACACARWTAGGCSALRRRRSCCRCTTSRRAGSRTRTSSSAWASSWAASRSSSRACGSLPLRTRLARPVRALSLFPPVPFFASSGFRRGLPFGRVSGCALFPVVREASGLLVFPVFVSSRFCLPGPWVFPVFLVFRIHASGPAGARRAAIVGV